eukprot:scaffold421_cov333-Pavlova_lutheri.AAC.4
MPVRRWRCVSGQPLFRRTTSPSFRPRTRRTHLTRCRSLVLHPRRLRQTATCADVLHRDARSNNNTCRWHTPASKTRKGSEDSKEKRSLSRTSRTNHIEPQSKGIRNQHEGKRGWKQGRGGEGVSSRSGRGGENTRWKIHTQTSSKVSMGYTCRLPGPEVLPRRAGPWKSKCMPQREGKQRYLLRNRNQTCVLDQPKWTVHEPTHGYKASASRRCNKPNDIIQYEGHSALIQKTKKRASMPVEHTKGKKDPFQNWTIPSFHTNEPIGSQGCYEVTAAKPHLGLVPGAH